MYTTLNKIRECGPCTDGWKKLLNHLGKTSADDEPLSLLTILDLNGLDDALWCFRAVDGFEKERLLLAITYAREVQHLMSGESKKALDVFERYANGLATEEEFKAAREAACSAAADAYGARAACAAADAADAYATASAATAVCAAGAVCADDAGAVAADASDADVTAAWATYAAARAARAAAWVVDAADASARAAADAWVAARTAAWAAALSVIKAKQEAQLRQLLERTS